MRTIGTQKVEFGGETDLEIICSDFASPEMCCEKILALEIKESSNSKYFASTREHQCETKKIDTFECEFFNELSNDVDINKGSGFCTFFVETTRESCQVRLSFTEESKEISVQQAKENFQSKGSQQTADSLSAEATDHRVSMDFDCSVSYLSGEAGKMLQSHSEEEHKEKTANVDCCIEAQLKHIQTLVVDKTSGKETDLLSRDSDFDSSYCNNETRNMFQSQSHYKEEFKDTTLMDFCCIEAPSKRTRTLTTDELICEETDFVPISDFGGTYFTEEIRNMDLLSGEEHKETTLKQILCTKAESMQTVVFVDALTGEETALFSRCFYFDAFYENEKTQNMFQSQPLPTDECKEITSKTDSLYVTIEKFSKNECYVSMDELCAGYPGKISMHAKNTTEESDLIFYGCLSVRSSYENETSRKMCWSLTSGVFWCLDDNNKFENKETSLTCYARQLDNSNQSGFVYGNGFDGATEMVNSYQMSEESTKEFTSEGIASMKLLDATHTKPSWPVFDEVKDATGSPKYIGCVFKNLFPATLMMFSTGERQQTVNECTASCIVTEYCKKNKKCVDDLTTEDLSKKVIFGEETTDDTASQLAGVRTLEELIDSMNCLNSQRMEAEDTKDSSVSSNISQTDVGLFTRNTPTDSETIDRLCSTFVFSFEHDMDCFCQVCPTPLENTKLSSKSGILAPVDELPLASSNIDDGDQKIVHNRGAKEMKTMKVREQVVQMNQMSPETLKKSGKSIPRSKPFVWKYFSSKKNLKATHPEGLILTKQEGVGSKVHPEAELIACSKRTRK